MQIDDVTVEVRDLGLNRIGQIRQEDLSLTASLLFCNVGKWNLSLPGEHPMVRALQTPGAGILVYGPNDVLFSGPMVKATMVQSTSDPLGALAVEGVTDEVVLADALAFPQPSNANSTTQTVAQDTRSGTVEDLLYAFVNANIGPSAPAARKVANLIMGTNLHRGPSTKKSARFDQLGVLLSAIASVSNLGFRVVQRGAQRVFEVYQVVDRTAEIRLDLWGNTIASQEVGLTSPSTTRTILGTSYAGNTTAAAAAEAAWGRRIERYVDQTSTDPTEQKQASDEILTNEGITGTTAKLTPSDMGTMRFGIDWYLGDQVATIAGDQQFTAPVTTVAIAIDNAGLRAGAILGDPSKIDPNMAANARMTSALQRISQLERASSLA